MILINVYTLNMLLLLHTAFKKNTEEQIVSATICNKDHLMTINYSAKKKNHFHQVQIESILIQCEEHLTLFALSGNKILLLQFILGAIEIKLK